MVVIWTQLFTCQTYEPYRHCETGQEHDDPVLAFFFPFSTCRACAPAVTSSKNKPMKDNKMFHVHQIIARNSVGTSKLHYPEPKSDGSTFDSALSHSLHNGIRDVVSIHISSHLQSACLCPLFRVQQVFSYECEHALSQDHAMPEIMHYYPPH